MELSSLPGSHHQPGAHRCRRSWKRSQCVTARARLSQRERIWTQQRAQSCPGGMPEPAHTVVALGWCLFSLSQAILEEKEQSGIIFPIEPVFYVEFHPKPPPRSSRIHSKIQMKAGCETLLPTAPEVSPGLCFFSFIWTQFFCEELVISNTSA